MVGFLQAVLRLRLPFSLVNSQRITCMTLMANYAPLPVSFTHGQGVWLWDADGKAYLDAVSGIAVCSLGHAHAILAKALCQQAQTLLHTSNLYHIELQQQLGQKLVELANMETVFFANSGAEANEAAIKLIRLYGHQRQISYPKIIVMEHSFHGRTLATLSATGNAKIQQGFAPLLPDFIQVPFNDIHAIQALVEQHNVVAVMVEPVQGEGGVNIPDNNYLQQLRQLCDQQQCLLVLDEIQTGMGRTGQWFAHQHQNIVPDIMTLAKALGNGVPIGACLAKGEAAKLFQAGSHGSTFGGNPLSMRAALTVIDIIEQQQLLTKATELGKQITHKLAQELAGVEGVVAIRHLGLMIGIELNQPCVDLMKQALAQGLLINVTAQNVIRLLPPLILNSEEVEQLVSTLALLIKNFQDQHLSGH